MKPASMQTSQALGCLAPGLLAAFGLAADVRAADAPYPDHIISLVVPTVSCRMPNPAATPCPTPILLRRGPLRDCATSIRPSTP